MPKPHQVFRCGATCGIVVRQDARVSRVRALGAQQDYRDTTVLEIGQFLLGGAVEDQPVALPSGGDLHLLHFPVGVVQGLDAPVPVVAHELGNSSHNGSGRPRPDGEAYSYCGSLRHGESHYLR
jgi:hypothetical protein